MKVSDKVEFLPTNSLKPDPNQPRKEFDTETIESLAQTILTQGIIAPIEIDENNMIITGELRWRASKRAGVPTIPCRRIYDISRDERLERQLIENIHRKDLDSKERDRKIYELYMSGRYGEPHQGQGMIGEGAITKLANALGLTVQTISNIIEAVEFRIRTSSVPEEATTTVIAETRGLPDETRVKLLEKVAEKEIKQKPGQTEIRKAVKIVREAPEPVRKRFLEGELSLEKAAEITEAVKEAPEPIRQAAVEGKITTEQARETTELYRKLRERGTEIPEKKIEDQVEELSRERRFLERRRKSTIGKMRKVLTGEEIEKPQITWSRLFCGTINNLSGAREGNITHNRIRFFAKTPSEIVCPHFWEFIWATGCSFRPACAWCYLQGTFRGDITPRFFEKEELEKQLEAWFNDVETLSCHLTDRHSDPQILVTGELADSLMGEQYWKQKYGVPFSHWIIQSFEKQKKHKVLFLTKSDKVENLLAINPHKQAIVSFSLNAEQVAKQWEKGAYTVSPIRNRIEMAGRLKDAGYEVRVRIDPMVPIMGWETQYKELVEDIFSRFTPERITIGSLRGLESTIRFCMDRTWVNFLSKDPTGWGRKIPDDQRQIMYSTLISYLKNKHDFSKIGLCKETYEMWRKINIDAGTYPYWSECKCNCVS
jgi:ParB/RepB/Spo0J family partition protein